MSHWLGFQQTQKLHSVLPKSREITFGRAVCFAVGETGVTELSNSVSTMKLMKCLGLRYKVCQPQIIFLMCSLTKRNQLAIQFEMNIIFLVK